MSRIAVYGGSFNPPHTGHVLAARELIRVLELDRLLIVPAADPPHKTLPLGSPSAQDRFALCEAAFAGIPGVELTDLELRRGGKSYTVDTLQSLRERYPDDELILVMGTDMLLSFRSWREPERIVKLAKLAVMHREEEAAVWEQTLREAKALERDMGTVIFPVENRCIQISSTTVRRLLALGAPDCLPPAVEARILEQGWYLTGDLRNLPFEELKRVSLELHDPKRRPHVVGTCETAEALARHWGADPEAARRAGILHDITKALGAKEQLHICQKYGMMLTKLQLENDKLLHAKTGALAAREIFGEAPAVVDAIWWHTTGRANMELLEKIIYIADYMEPTRNFPGVEILRDLVWKDLDAAVYQGLDQAVSYLRSRDRVIDPDSLAGWACLKKRFERSDPGEGKANEEAE